MYTLVFFIQVFGNCSGCCGQGVRSFIPDHFFSVQDNPTQKKNQYVVSETKMIHLSVIVNTHKVS